MEYPKHKKYQKAKEITKSIRNTKRRRKYKKLKYQNKKTNKQKVVENGHGAWGGGRIFLVVEEKPSV